MKEETGIFRKSISWGVSHNGRLLCFAVFLSAVSMSDAYVDGSGYIWMNGGSGKTWTSWDVERFVWNPDKNQLSAGTDNLSSNSAGSYTFALGDHAWAWDDYSVAVGQDVVSFNNFSYAFGYDILVSGTGNYGNVAMGYQLQATGDGSSVFGFSNIVSGDGAFAAGYDNTASGKGSVALGWNSSVTTSSSGPGAYAIGLGLDVDAPGTFVIGQYNVYGSDSQHDYLFVIGDGESPSSRSDAFWVDTQGNAGVKGGLDVQGAIMVNGNPIPGGYGSTMVSIYDHTDEGGQIKLVSATAGTAPEARNWEIDNNDGAFRIFSDDQNDLSDPVTLNALTIKEEQDVAKMTVHAELILAGPTGDIQMGAFGN